MRFAVLLLAGLVVTGSAIQSTVAAPVLTAVPTAYVNGLTAWDVSIQFDNDMSLAGWFGLTATSSDLQQRITSLGADVNLRSEVAAAAGDPVYDARFDSYWQAGPHTVASIATPPWNGVDLGSGVVGSNTYRASFGLNDAFGLTVPILHLVTDDPSGRIRIQGMIARVGLDHEIDQSFVIPEPSSAAFLWAALIGMALAGARLRDRKKIDPCN